MAELTHEDVIAILDLLERSNVEYLEVEVGGTRLVADRSGTTVTAGRPAPAAAVGTPPAPVAAPASPSSPGAASAAAPAVAPPAPPAPAPAAEDLVTVNAPMVGTFYRAPEPGAPPFVETGSRVEEGATLGLIEVMKMFNSVSAPAAGEVVQVLVGNDEFVEFGQPLLTLRPA